MISNPWFWNSWSKSERIIFYFFLSILGFGVFYTCFSWFLELHNVLKWDTLSQLQDKIVNLPSFSDGTFNFTSNTLVYYVKERYLPSLIKINELAYYFLLLFIVSGISSILTALSKLKGIWFLIGGILIASFIISLRLESVYVTTSSLPFFISFMLLGGLYYYFSNWSKAGVLFRFCVFFASISIIFLFPFLLHKVNQPLLLSLSYGLLLFLIISMIFIFFISHEILAILIWMVSKTSQKGKSSLTQFSIVSAIFFANAVLVYLENANFIENSFAIINPLLIFLVSMVLGIWGFRKSTEDQAYFSFKSIGMWLYFGMAAISVSVYAFIFATANDPLQDMFEDYISISQVSVGICFFVYVLVNFFQVFRQGLDVHMVLYKPKFSRLILARVGSLFIIAFLFSFKNFYSYYQVLAGYNNALADSYLIEGDLKIAETYYKESTHYDLYNHKANYSLASLALNQNDKLNASFFFKQSLKRKASEFAYAGLSQSLEQEDMYFESLFTLQEGMKKFPESSIIASNLAYLYEKAKNQDSTFIYLDKAQKVCKSCEVENTNLLAFWIENAAIEKLDSVSKTLFDTYSSNIANKTAIDKILLRETEKFEKVNTNVLNVSDFAGFYNFSSNVLNKGKFSNTQKEIATFLKEEANQDFYSDLIYLKSVAQYNNQNKIEGIKTMHGLVSDSTSKGLMYRQNLAMWYLQEGVYDKAIEYLLLSGDASSANMLKEKNYFAHIQDKLQQQAGTLTKDGISKNTIESIKQKAPLNPFLIQKISDYYSKQKNLNAAYQVYFDALELNPTNALLWKGYTLKSLDLGIEEYSNKGLNELRKFASSTDYQAFLADYQAKKTLIEKSRQSFK